MHHCLQCVMIDMKVESEGHITLVEMGNQWCYAGGALMVMHGILVCGCTVVVSLDTCPHCPSSLGGLAKTSFFQLTDSACVALCLSWPVGTAA